MTKSFGIMQAPALHSDLVVSVAFWASFIDRWFSCLECAMANLFGYFPTW
jgi:hypothetical protein